MHNRTRVRQCLMLAVAFQLVFAMFSPIAIAAALRTDGTREAAGVGNASSAAPDKAGLVPDSLLKWQFIGDPEISPDGSRIAYVRSSVDEDKDTYKSSIWIADVATGNLKQFTLGDTRDVSPRWSPDGKRLAFVSTRRPGGPQIYVLSLDGGGEATQITHAKNGASAPHWSPDGRWIAFNSRVAPEEKKDPEGSAQDKANKAGTMKPRIINRLAYRINGPGYIPEGSTHIFVVSSDGGEAKQITTGDFNDDAPSWSPDSSQLAFSSIRTADPEYALDDSEIFVVSTQGGTPKQLTNRRGPDGSPVWSPDGKHIAYTGNDEKNQSYTVTKLYCMNADGSGSRELTAAYDRGIGDGVGSDVGSPAGGGPERVQWSHDSARLLFVSGDRGNANIHWIPASGGKVEELTTGDHDIEGFTIAQNGRLATIITDGSNPPDLFTRKSPESEFQRLTNINSQNLGAISKPEMFWYKSFDGRQVQGWVMKPIGFTDGARYPMILYIHGGPHGEYGNTFFHEFQVLAGRGYVVLFTNPRGSTGYGQEFGNIIQYKYPGDDYKDLMTGVDEVIKRGYVDEKRMQVMGGSGGGLLTAWVVGQTTRFASAIGERGVYDWYSFVTTADFNLTFARRWFRDFPWNDPKDYLARSPVTYVKNVTTPLLIIGSEEDYRVPLSQAEELYTSLKMLKKEVKLVRFPQESHELSRSGRPSHRITRLKLILDWTDQHLHPDDRAAAQ